MLLAFVQGQRLRWKLIKNYPDAIEKTPFGFMHNPIKFKRNIKYLKSDYEIFKLMKQVKLFFYLSISLPIFTFGILIAMITLLK
jgi:hypothetical protein